MYNLLAINYNNLFNEYCKFQDKKVIINASSCEDNFDDKILIFLQLDIPDPTIETLTLFLKTKRNKVQQIFCCEYQDCFPQVEDEEKSEIIKKLQLLFLDYRPEKIKQLNGIHCKKTKK